jgi:hypothetical protein
MYYLFISIGHDNLNYVDPINLLQKLLVFLYNFNLVLFYKN